MNPPSPRSRRGPLLVLVLAFVALLALPVLIATVGVDEQRDAAGAAGTTTEVPTTGGATTSSDPATTTTDPAPTTTEATVPETTTTTIDLDAVYAFAAKLDAATSTTTTAPPAPEPLPEPQYVPEPVVQYEPVPEPEPVYEAPAAPTYGGDPFAGLSGSDRDFLACIRNRESGGDYTVVNPSSGAGGAYQFLINTWNNTAANAGRSDLIGTSPQYASPYDQDLLAAHLLQWQGRAPWSYSCY